MPRMEEPGWTSVVIKIPETQAREMEDIISCLGLKTRGEYFKLLHVSLKTAVTRPPEERLVLRALGDWGELNNWPSAVTLDQIAGSLRLEKNAAHKIILKLFAEGLLLKVPITPGKFSNDIILGNVRYQLSVSGRAAARAAILLDARHAHPNA